LPGADRYVSVRRIADGRWTHRLVVDGIPGPEGVAYEKRVEAVSAASHLYPEDEIVVEGK
jgi:hypothetical protein